MKILTTEKMNWFWLSIFFQISEDNFQNIIELSIENEGAFGENLHNSQDFIPKLSIGSLSFKDDFQYFFGGRELDGNALDPDQPIGCLQRKQNALFDKVSKITYELVWKNR